MKDRGNIRRASRYYIFRSRDTWVNFFLLICLALAYTLALYKGAFDQRGGVFLGLLVYALVLGLGTIMSNSMLVDLTVKDVYKGRIGFFLASGMDIGDIIRAYSIEMWRIANIVPFFIFLLTYLLYDFGENTRLILAIYVSSVLLTYLQILYFNIISIYRKNFKLFKNILFFFTSLLIFLVGTFADNLINFFASRKLSILVFILVFNIFLTLVLGLGVLRRKRTMTNEDLLGAGGSWS